MRFLPLLTLFLFASVQYALAIDQQDVVALTLANNQKIVQFQANRAERAAGIGAAQAAFYPSLDLDYAYSNSHNPPVLEAEERAILSLSASYNLFNGLIDSNSVDAAKARTRAADFLLKSTTADLILDSRLAYIAQLRARRSVETSREGVELLQRQHRDTRLKYQQGLIARNDLLRVEVELSSAKQDLLKAKGELQIAKRRLERLIRTSLPADQTLEDFQELPQIDDVEAEAFRTQLFQKRSELRYLNSLLNAADHDRSVARGNNLPRVDLNLAHEEYGDSISPLNSDIEDDNKLLLTASWNLFNGFATRQAMAAVDSRKRSLAAEIQDTRDELFLQLQEALTNLRVAQGNQKEAETGVAQAEENYRVTDNLYKQQQATTFDLLDARFLLTRARNQEVNARYDLHDRSAILDRVLERGIQEVATVQ